MESVLPNLFNSAFRKLLLFNYASAEYYNDCEDEEELLITMDEIAHVQASAVQVMEADRRRFANAAEDSGYESDGENLENLECILPQNFTIHKWMFFTFWHHLKDDLTMDASPFSPDLRDQIRFFFPRYPLAGFHEMLQYRNHNNYCKFGAFIASYQELSCCGPVVHYEVWRNVIFSYQESITCAWFFSNQIDHAILRFDSLILYYMHMYAKFLATRFSSYCIDINCNNMCPQFEDVGNLFYIPSPGSINQMEREIQKFKDNLGAI